MAYEKITTNSFIRKSETVHGKGRYDYSKVNYVNAKTKVIIVCKKCGYEWESLPHNHMSGRGCKKCQYKKLPQNQPRNHETFLKEAEKVHGKNRFDYLTSYKNKRTKIKIKCSECGEVFEQRPDSHLEGCGCRKCFYQNNPKNQAIPFEEYEMMASKVHGNDYEYFSDYKGMRRKIKIRCKIHDIIFKQEAGAHIKGQGCPICRSSKGEQAIRKFLIENNIDFCRQKIFKECLNEETKKFLRFDFWLGKCYNICIEYDGEQHFFPVDCFGGKKRHEEIKRLDEIKNDFCKRNNIKLIRIPFYEFKNIKSILQKEILCQNQFSTKEAS